MAGNFKEDVLQAPITSTYRLQLRGPQADPSGRAFGFDQAAQCLPYLESLGISHVYLSPILQALPTSNHNYDVTDPTVVNPELGGLAGFRRFVEAARKLNLGVIIDIVPNHLGVASPQLNSWWWDVLKHGRDSEYERYFDIDWHADNGAGGKLGLPIFGKEHDEDALTLRYLDQDNPESGIVLAYYDNVFPLKPGTCSSLDDDPKEVYERQSYKLMFWRDGIISYRRFFSVNGLAGIRQEDPAVFEHTHAIIRQLVAEDLIDGVRVDHPDGLTDPFGYLSRLRDVVGPDRWLVVEKILEADEPLDPRLRVNGTTGYDALRELDGIFVNQTAEDTLSMLALRQSGSTWDQAALDAAALQLKREVATHELQAEVRRLTRAIRRDNFSTAGSAVSDEILVDTVIALVAAIPVYRADYRSLSRITATVVADMAQRFPSRRDALDLIAAALLAEGEASTRFAQVCGAVMAKGVEDTLFYRANRLVALQEVGGAPGRFGVGAAEFHLLQQERAELWPQTMTTLSTHDTKRSEDTRARMLEIAEVPNAFAELVNTTTALLPPPDHATAHFLLQNIVGVWPADGIVTESLSQRLHDYAIKAVREAALHTSWFDADEAYEQQVLDWVNAVLAGPATSLITDFVSTIHEGAVAVTLGRKVLQLAGAGIPDTYQGMEFFETTLVDPDNRSFIDYTARTQTLHRYLDARQQPQFNLGDFLGCEQDGSPGRSWPGLSESVDAAKQLVIRECLTARKTTPTLFTEGKHRAVFAVGPSQQHFVGFAREHRDTAEIGMIAVATRKPLELARRGGWEDTTLTLPQGSWFERFTGREFHGTVPVGVLLEYLPTALLERREALD